MRRAVPLLLTESDVARVLGYAPPPEWWAMPIDRQAAAIRYALSTEGPPDSDPLVRGFLEHRCVFDPDGRVDNAKLYEAWLAWLTHIGEPPRPQKALSVAMRAHGLDQRRDRERYWVGVRLSYDSG